MAHLLPAIVGALACISAGALASLRSLWSIDKVAAPDLKYAMRSGRRRIWIICASDAVLGASIGVALSALHISITIPSLVELQAPDWPVEGFCALWALGAGLVVGSIVIGTKDVLRSSGLSKIPGAEAVQAILNIAFWPRHRGMRSISFRAVTARDRRLIPFSTDLYRRYHDVVERELSRASELVGHIESYYEFTGDEWDPQILDLVTQWNANSATLTARERRELLKRMCGRLAKRRIYRPTLSVLADDTP